MQKKIADILDSLLAMGASYADIRWHQDDWLQSLSTLKGILHQNSTRKRQGAGIRVLCDGAWGFSSTENMNTLADTAKAALEQARSAAQLRQFKIELSPKETLISEFQTHTLIDPRTVSLEDKMKRLFELDQLLRAPEVDLWSVSFEFYHRSIYYADTEGSKIWRKINDVAASLDCSGIDIDGLRQKRSFEIYQDINKSVGWENIIDQDLNVKASQLVDQLKEILKAPQCEQETCDLVILNSMMALQVHETIGHALELDRILGYELSYAGGSHVNLDDFDHKVFGSKKLNARADGTTPNSPGTTGFDDDGVPGRNVVLIDNGILKNALTSRSTINEANTLAKRKIFDQSGGANRAESYRHMPIERMNNINLDPGNDGELEELISKVKNGLMVESPRSWSIGSNRENFHFACEIGWKIKDGKISHIVRNPTYGGASIPFWNSLKYVGDKSTWRLEQVYNCGKGQPNQIMRLGHGVPVCVFENVQVGSES
ncbi:MAG: hypothetical protein COV37_06390 [Bdellovibrio sp. CG11_big_fil_rev_8_21_14_0_20_39_38]|nr:MAG: hypothetical protein COW78_02185 [Bdellovibrio sp. CG22_combo_CG10-13_8_21_14_all_39_27]PIR35823.1 MAG: hypothetical protein COV37_06390 [Bdellovibrio sp. CG11_big_fil_rev_8_21_14_0_20_39_38]